MRDQFGVKTNLDMYSNLLFYLELDTLKRTKESPLIFGHFPGQGKRLTYYFY